MTARPKSWKCSRCFHQLDLGVAIQMLRLRGLELEYYAEFILPAPALGQLWKKGQGPLWHFDIKAQTLEKKRTTASPNGSPFTGTGNEGRFE